MDRRRAYGHSGKTFEKTCCRSSIRPHNTSRRFVSHSLKNISDRYQGPGSLPERYRKPVNDGIVCSGISGYLNILDIPTFSKELALLGYRLSGEEAPACLAESFKNGEIHFDFELPGSTHNMRVSDPFFCALSHSGDQAFSGSGSLKILVDRMVRGDQCKVFYKPFYTRNDFSDERYSPVFSPTAYPGQTVSMKLYLDQWEGWGA